ncbi:MAG: sigma 54-interacting transcriptional regulator [Gammaproteobacteria bacterium]|nr:sigma 54-interacting transcriptional regulator [Gammaproteobacteria bacterium]
MDTLNSLVGRSPALESVLRNARMAAATNVTVLILGETGTGKELLTEALQQSSSRANKAFVKINCAALPETLAESELFGHTKGAFTGAVSDSPGKLKAANGGTVFLDEIDSLDISLQGKLLRFLESGECQAVGKTSPDQVDVRVIAATNCDLGQRVSKGEFRKDLYYRLNVVPLELPSLRDRGSDVIALINHFIDLTTKEHALDKPKLTKAAYACLKSYRWPGNVRELKNLCERLCILRQGQIIDISNLPAEISSNTSTQSNHGFSLPDTGINLESLEIDLIRQALDRTNGNRSKSARLLGISRDTMLYRMNKYNLA